MGQHHHPLAVYTYGDKSSLGADLGVEIRDARDILPEDSHYHKYRAEQRFGMFANIFRLYLLKYNKGTWVDLDCYFLKPLSSSSEHVFGFSSPNKINNAVLRIAPNSELIDDYISAITADPLQIPWASISRQLKRKFEIFKGQSQPHPNFKTNIGPKALTYFVKKHGLLSYAQHQEVYYPLPAKEISLLLQPEEQVLPKLTDNAIMIHAWRNTLKFQGYLNSTPPADSYIGKACRGYNVTN